MSFLKSAYVLLYSGNFPLWWHEWAVSLQLSSMQLLLIALVAFVFISIGLFIVVFFYSFHTGNEKKKSDTLETPMQQPAPTQEIHNKPENQPAQQETGVKQVIKEKLTLNNEKNLLKTGFSQIQQQFQQQYDQIADELLPYWRLSSESEQTKLSRYYPETSSPDFENNIAQLFTAILEFWDAGYRDPEMALFTCLYIDRNKNFDIMAKKAKILKISSFKQIQNDTRLIISFLFQDYFETHTSQHPQVNAAIVEHPRYLFCADLHNENVIFTRSEFFEYENRLATKNIFEKDLIEKYQDLLFQNSSFYLKWYLYRTYGFYFEQADHLLEISALRTGKYSRLLRLSNIEPAHNLLQFNFKNWPGIEQGLQILEDYFNTKPFGYLHLNYTRMCAHDYFVDKPQPASDDEEPIQERFQLSQYNNNKDLTLYLKKLMVYYLANYEKWQMLLVFSESLPHLFRDETVLFFEARALCFTSECSKALEQIEALREKFSGNPAYLNENAVIAYLCGDIERAEQLFSTLKDRFPGLAAALHNDTVLYEKKLQNQLQQKWNQYHSLNSSNSDTHSGI